MLTRLLRRLFWLLADLALALALWAVWMALRVSPVHPGPALGNTARSREALPARGPDAPIRFAVISDIEEGVETFRAALDEFARRRPDFVVINGDLAYRPTEQGFRYFEWQFPADGWPGPYFCNPGNHDLVDRRDAALFRRHFGEDRFAFRLGACQFLLVNNCVNGLSDADYAWIEAAAREADRAGPPIRHRFLFLHYPPFAAPKREDVLRPLPGYERLYALAPALKIRRVFSGNLHAYRRMEANGVPYVVCGGGGADLHSPEAFHHFVWVTVEGDVARDEIVRLPTIRSPVEAADRFAYLYVWPRLRDRPLLSVPLLLGLLAAAGWQARAAWRAARRRR